MARTTKINYPDTVNYRDPRYAMQGAGSSIDSGFAALNRALSGGQAMYDFEYDKAREASDLAIQSDLDKFKTLAGYKQAEEEGSLGVEAMSAKYRRGYDQDAFKAGKTAALARLRGEAVDTAYAAGDTAGLSSLDLNQSTASMEQQLRASGMDERQIREASNTYMEQSAGLKSRIGGEISTRTAGWNTKLKEAALSDDPKAMTSFLQGMSKEANPKVLENVMSGKAEFLDKAFNLNPLQKDQLTLESRINTQNIERRALEHDKSTAGYRATLAQFGPVDLTSAAKDVDSTKIDSVYEKISDKTGWLRSAQGKPIARELGLLTQKYGPGVAERLMSIAFAATMTGGGTGWWKQGVNITAMKQHIERIDRFSKERGEVASKLYEADNAYKQAELAHQSRFTNKQHQDKLGFYQQNEGINVQKNIDTLNAAAPLPEDNYISRDVPVFSGAYAKPEVITPKIEEDAEPLNMLTEDNQLDTDSPIIRMTEQGKQVLYKIEEGKAVKLSDDDAAAYMEKQPILSQVKRAEADKHPWPSAESKSMWSKAPSSKISDDSDTIRDVQIPQKTLAYRNNNPGNLRLAGQKGASKGEGGFAKFATPIEGYRALVKDLTGKISGKSKAINNKYGRPAKTLAEIIAVYAPPSENDTNEYANFVAKELGISINTDPKNINISDLAKAMAKKESGTKIN